MKRFFMLVAGMFMTATMLTGCGYNEIQTLDESTKAAWSEVLNQYQRRNDLIPNVVNSVKGEADFEKSTLTDVINARAKATSIQATPELMENPEAFKKFTQAQGELSNALSRLLVTVERYPELKSNAAFQELRVQLEGCENRIAIARNRYIKTVQEYNTYIRQFPQMVWVWILGYKPKAQYTVADEAAITTPPKVDFGGTTAPAPAK
ncbi:LemA family protein [Parasutterella muris]|uniref:LemA family protein n=3 Tax=Parasutterella TaxID=577310 RepID=A0A6L6YG99_9BURK|nr:LemA family protein [Parasutterella muris]MVX56636.1 LemA family protein [Parasutterella muris]